MRGIHCYVAVCFATCFVHAGEKHNLRLAKACADSAAQTAWVDSLPERAYEMRAGWINKKHSLAELSKRLDSLATTLGRPTGLRAAYYLEVPKSGVVEWYYVDESHPGPYYAVSVNRNSKGRGYEFCRIFGGYWYQLAGGALEPVDSLGTSTDE